MGITSGIVGSGGFGKVHCSLTEWLTFSSYYGGNVAKAGVFLQLCGWLGGFEPGTGALSDTDYFERGGILEEQEEFQKWDTSSLLAFINVLDKGYRCNLAAWRKRWSVTFAACLRKKRPQIQQ
jgi:hypothetical protein